MTSRTNSSRSNKSSCKPEKRKVRAVTRIRPFFATNNRSTPFSTELELESCVVQISANHIGFMQQKYDKIVEQTFKFDTVYNTNSKQEDIFSKEVEPLMEHILNGKKCTIFCYGPTGSGKTFTAFGCNDNPGIMARTIQCILDVKFDKIQENMHKNNKYECKILLSSLEIYNERVYDLLSINNNITLHKQGLQVRQINDDILVQGLSKTELTSMEQFYAIYNRSMKQRKTAFTVLNAHSSRSHAIFTIYMEQKMHIISTKKCNNSKTRHICGKLSIADLAGSENNKRTENTGDRLTESKNINKSLFALGKVIEALNRGTKPPYRDSVLTRLLSDCLGGHSMSTMICCVSGSLTECLMTRRCLEFGSNTRKIENKIIAHITTTNNNANNTNHKKRKYNDVNSNMSHKHNKRIKLSKKTASMSSTDEIHGTPNQKLNKKQNKKKKKIRYSIQPTPSKFIPNDAHNLQKHEEIVRNKMIDKIDELTKNVVKITGILEQKSEEVKEEERELSVYRNDSFGLPPVYTPAVANAALAVSKIKEARKLEKKGKIKQALRKYEQAKILLPQHKNLQKKIEKLLLKFEPGIIQQLHFEDDDCCEENEAVKSKKKRKILRKKRNVEIKINDPVKTDVVAEDEALDSSEFSYRPDTERILNTMNDSTMGQLKTLATIGSSKAAAIVACRPFHKITHLRKIKGFNTLKSWNKFIEHNKLVFQNK